VQEKTMGCWKKEAKIIFKPFWPNTRWPWPLWGFCVMG